MNHAESRPRFLASGSLGLALDSLRLPQPRRRLVAGAGGSVPLLTG